MEIKIKIETEYDLHTKVVSYIKRFYKDVIIVASLGENQISPSMRIKSYYKGYMKRSPDLLILNRHKRYSGLAIEFQNPTGRYKISDSQLQMKKLYKKNGFKFIISNDYDLIIRKFIFYIAELV